MLVPFDCPLILSLWIIANWAEFNILCFCWRVLIGDIDKDWFKLVLCVPPRWRCVCLSSSGSVRKRRLHPLKIHIYGRLPTCSMTCIFSQLKLNDSLPYTLHPTHKHRYFFCPCWDNIWFWFKWTMRASLRVAMLTKLELAWLVELGERAGIVE